MKHISLNKTLHNILAMMPSDHQKEVGQGANVPKRYFYQRPEDKGSFILPLKQSFVKDARLMPGTRCMLALLVGWAGKGRDLRTTQGALGRHLGRSVRQIFRYLKDAAREGYLTYNYTKNRIGAIIGIKIFLSFELLRPNLKKKPKIGRKQDRTLVSDTNTLLKDSYIIDVELEKRLDKFREVIINSSP
ncbi:hypothetical protein GCM10011344_42650 [Dokdonia pacifica]|uniref:Helix-turn-helix domain-containing protein n=1 Tax=Dokdonia pacifica TaxID=1627892 RepID=A0A239AHX9_9FLAO|nr:hypothetical protein [Dokdonia pacifica]GGG37303.1 hypothetical protein GCM10011344_42650 [Dokdonia pacifica]SNR95276.1 hypothetical protein SAMN06265376_104459 [Dokdonia pacifica]